MWIGSSRRFSVDWISSRWELRKLSSLLSSSLLATGNWEAFDSCPFRPEMIIFPKQHISMKQSAHLAVHFTLVTWPCRSLNLAHSDALVNFQRGEAVSHDHVLAGWPSWKHRYGQFQLPPIHPLPAVRAAFQIIWKYFFDQVLKYFLLERRMKRSSSDWMCKTLGPMSVKRQINKAREFQEKGIEMTPTTQKTVQTTNPEPIPNDGEDHRGTFKPFPIEQFFWRTLV